MSFHGLAETSDRSACVTSDPSGSRRSSRRCAESTTSSRPSGRKSMHIGNDGTVAITWWLPSAPSAITWFAPQSENQTRPSCQRGDSPNTMPSIRTSGALTTFLPLLDNGIDQDRRRNSSRISGKPAISVVGAGLGCASPLQMGCWLTAATRDVEFAERGPGQFVCSNAVGPPTQPGRLGGAILARPELTDGILTADRDRLSF